MSIIDSHAMRHSQRNHVHQWSSEKYKIVEHAYRELVVAARMTRTGIGGIDTKMSTNEETSLGEQGQSRYIDVQLVVVKRNEAIRYRDT